MSPEKRASAALDFLGALAVAALLAIPFVVYFWNMTP
jgi:hypothetical protein